MLNVNVLNVLRGSGPRAPALPRPRLAFSRTPPRPPSHRRRAAPRCCSPRPCPCTRSCGSAPPPRSSAPRAPCRRRRRRPPPPSPSSRPSPTGSLAGRRRRLPRPPLSLPPPLPLPVGRRPRRGRRGLGRPRRCPRLARACCLIRYAHAGQARAGGGLAVRASLSSSLCAAPPAALSPSCLHGLASGVRPGGMSPSVLPLLSNADHDPTQLPSPAH
jgi:hypothetical protein